MKRTAATLRTGIVLLMGVMSDVAFSAATVDFSRSVRPVLADNCFECHGPDSARRKAGLRLDIKAGMFANKQVAVVVPGDPEASELYRRLTAEDEAERMPPTEAHRHPDAKQIRLIRQWIEEGAPYAEHWAFSAPVRSSLKSDAVDEWGRNGIDALVLAGLQREGLRPQPEADRATLIRRLSFDLRGLPPALAEIDAFVGDSSPQAFERLVERYLASPRYGEHMAWGWMEAARYADTDGFQSDATRHMWRWRDWVIEAFNRNLPYDQFTIEQLAGDLLPDAGLQQHLATGFNRNHRYDKGSGTIQAESVFENAVDRLETTATVWLGLTMNCARCHDHKFDPISSREYYEMLAFFDKVPENGQAILFNSHPRMKTPTREQSQRLAELDRGVAQAEANLDSLKHVAAEEQRTWERGLNADFEALPMFRDGLADLFHLDRLESRGQERAGKVMFGKGVRGGAMYFGSGSYFEFDPRVGNLWGREEFSLSFWFRLDDLGDGALLSELDDPDDYRLGTLIDVKDGRLRFMLSHRWNYAVTWFSLREPLQTNRWYHFAVTCDGRLQMLAYRAYLDGQRAEFDVIQDSAVDGKKVNVPMMLGWSPLGPGFRGALDELRIQRRVLNAEEIAALGTRRSLEAIATTPEKMRTDAERKALQFYFMEHVATGALAEARDRLLAAERERKRYYDTLPTTMVMQDDPEAAVSRIRIKGQYDQPGEMVRPDTPRVLPAFPTGLPRNRLGFAQWLMVPENPLTARVAVNRIWQNFFGRGFVDSPENFGTQCPEPVQIELLDWLAAEFVRLDWDVKELIRLIVGSATYRQASSAPAALWQQDPDNRYLARGPRHRLSAPVLRDQSLMLSGLLDGSIGGESVFPFQPVGLWRLTSNKAYEMSDGVGRHRRSLYTFWRRAIAPPTMALFDAPGREICSVAVKRTNTPLQALAALNEQAAYEAAQALGRRIAGAACGSDAGRLQYGFALVTGREPSVEETAVLVAAWERMKGAEEPFSLLANMLLNLDKTLTKE